MNHPNAHITELISRINKSTLSPSTLESLYRVEVIIVDDSSEIAYTDFDKIYLQNRKTLMDLLGKSNSDSINNVESIVVQIEQLEKAILNHEIAHFTEDDVKKISTKIYNEKLLPNIYNGSMGVVDEISFTENLDKMRNFMLSDFRANYKPNSDDLERFNSYINDYFLPNGPFGIVNDTANLDNIIVDIWIENNLINMMDSGNKELDDSFFNLRRVLYSTSSDSEEYGLLRALQIFIDPRFEGTPELEKVKKSKKFEEFLNIDISDLIIDRSLFIHTDPKDKGEIQLAIIINELLAHIKKMRDYGYMNAILYQRYKDENNLNSSNISLLASKLAKVIYIKKIQLNENHENDIEQLLKDDKHINFNSSGSKNEDNNLKNSNLLNEFSEYNSFEDTLEKLGHNRDIGYEANKMLNNSSDIVENYLIRDLIAQEFGSNIKEDLDIIKDSVKKDINYLSYKNNKELVINRMGLLNSIQETNEYRNLIDDIEKLKTKIGAIEFKNNSGGNAYSLVDDYLNGNEFLYSLNGSMDLNLFIHCFIDDSISMSRKVDEKYTLMDYQVVNTLLILDLFKDIEGVRLLVSSFPENDSSLNIIYDSEQKENENFLGIEAIKDSSPLYKTIVETNIKIKSMETDKEIVNIFTSDGDDNMDKDYGFTENLFNKITQDSYFLQIGGDEIKTLNKNFDDRYFRVNSTDDIKDNIYKLLNSIHNNLDNKLESSLDINNIQKDRSYGI